MSLWYSSQISFLFACPTTMRTLLDRRLLSLAGEGSMRMVRCRVCCRRSLCLSSTTPSANPCTDPPVILSTYHTYSSVPVGRREATIPVKVCVPATCFVLVASWIMAMNNWTNYILNLQVIPVAPWCCNASRINAFNWAVSSPGALDVRRPISQASIRASPSSETGSIRFFSFSRILVVFACVLCLILSECPALGSTLNSNSNSCFGYDLLAYIESMRITQATISVNIYHVPPTPTIALPLPTTALPVPTFGPIKRNITNTIITNSIVIMLILKCLT